MTSCDDNTKHCGDCTNQDGCNRLSGCQWATDLGTVESCQPMWKCVPQSGAKTDCVMAQDRTGRYRDILSCTSACSAANPLTVVTDLCADTLHQVEVANLGDNPCNSLQNPSRLCDASGAKDMTDFLDRLSGQTLNSANHKAAQKYMADTDCKEAFRKTREIMSTCCGEGSGPSRAVLGVLIAGLAVLLVVGVLLIVHFSKRK